MATKESSRSYNCKDEELLMICNYMAYSFERDLASFSAFSPKFTPDYLTTFKESIQAAAELVEPGSETLARKEINDRLRETHLGLIDPVNRVEGYLKLAKAGVKSTPAAFGLSALRQSIRRNDPEGVIGNLGVVLSNINHYKPLLMAQGLTDDLIALLSGAVASINTYRQAQYVILTNRAALVKNNLGVLNNLNATLMEIINVGRILYKASDPVKKKEYSFAELRRKVRTDRRSPDNTVAAG